MMQYAPPGEYINETYYKCIGLEEEQAERPPVPLWMTQVCWVIIAVSVLFFLVNHALWYRNRHRAHIALARNFLSHGMEVAMLFTCAAATRRGYLDDSGNHPRQGCLATSTLYIAGVVIAATSYYMRLLQLRASMRRAKLIRENNKLHGEDDNGNESVNSATRLEYFMLLLKGLVAIDDHSSDDGNKALRNSSLAMKSSTIVLMTFIIFILAIMPVAILSGTVDAYNRKCVGCQWYIEFLATYTAVLIPFFIMAGRLLFKLRHEVDQYGVRRELVTSLVIGGTLTWIGIIVIAVDPNETERLNKFTFEWQIWVGFFVPAVIWGPYQSTYKANLREREVMAIANDIRGRQKPDDDQMNRPALMRNLLNDKFLDMAQAEFVMENISFLTDVEAWKRSYVSKDEQWKRKKGCMIINKYIREGSLLEINISDGERQKLVAKAEQEDEVFYYEAFDQAENEVVEMVLNGVWLHFVIAENQVTRHSVIAPAVQHVL